MRGEGQGAGGECVLFRNIRVEDPRPTLQQFFVAMQGLPPYSDPVKNIRGPGNISGVRFQDIDVVAPSVLAEQDILWGSPEAEIIDWQFENFRVAGKPVTNIGHFRCNDLVKGSCFRQTDAALFT